MLLRGKNYPFCKLGLQMAAQVPALMGMQPQGQMGNLLQWLVLHPSLHMAVGVMGGEQGAGLSRGARVVLLQTLQAALQMHKQHSDLQEASTAMPQLV